MNIIYPSAFDISTATFNQDLSTQTNMTMNHLV